MKGQTSRVRRSSVQGVPAPNFSPIQFAMRSLWNVPCSRMNWSIHWLAKHSW